MKNWLLNVLPCGICPDCDEVCNSWHFGTPGFYIRAPGPRTKMEKKVFHILDFTSKGFYQASIYMYIYLIALLCH